MTSLVWLFTATPDGGLAIAVVRPADIYEVVAGFYTHAQLRFESLNFLYRKASPVDGYIGYLSGGHSTDVGGQ